MRTMTASGIVERTIAGSAISASACRTAAKSPRTRDSSRRKSVANRASAAIARGDQSGIGSHRSVTAKRSIAIMPSQNTGTDEPSSASTCPTASTTRRGNAAPTHPISSPSDHGDPHRDERQLERRREATADLAAHRDAGLQPVVAEVEPRRALREAGRSGRANGSSSPISRRMPAAASFE